MPGLSQSLFFNTDCDHASMGTAALRNHVELPVEAARILRTGQANQRYDGAGGCLGALLCSAHRILHIPAEELAVYPRLALVQLDCAARKLCAVRRVLRALATAEPARH